MKVNFKTKDIILASLFVALISVGAYIKIPFIIIPFTLQLFFVLLAGQLLNAGMFALTMVTYIILGLVGLPVFSGGGGPGYVLTPSFGYVIGFLFCGTIISLLRKESNRSFIHLLCCNLIGEVVLYIFGISYYFILNTFYFGKTVAIWPMFVYCCFVFIPSDLLSSVMSVIVSKRIWPVLNK